MLTEHTHARIINGVQLFVNDFIFYVTESVDKYIFSSFFYSTAQLVMRKSFTNHNPDYPRSDLSHWVYNQLCISPHWFINWFLLWLTEQFVAFHISLLFKRKVKKSKMLFCEHVSRKWKYRDVHSTHENSDGCWYLDYDRWCQQNDITYCCVPHEIKMKVCTCLQNDYPPLKAVVAHDIWFQFRWVVIPKIM